MLKISEAAALALHTASLLAARPDRRVSTRDAADLFNVSEAHLSKVLQRLVKAGLVKSARGPKGGFVLARPGDRITLLEVYQAIEGTSPWDRCLLGHDVCPIDRCLMGDLVGDVNRRVHDYLSSTHLSQLADAFTVNRAP